MRNHRSDEGNPAAPIIGPSLNVGPGSVVHGPTHTIMNGETDMRALNGEGAPAIDLSGRVAIVKAYKLVRGSAGKNIEAALPALGALVQKYAG